MRGLALVAASAAALLSGCSDAAGGAGALRVEMAIAELASSRVASVTVTVAPGAGHPFVPFEALATRRGDL